MRRKGWKCRRRLSLLPKAFPPRSKRERQKGERGESKMDRGRERKITDVSSTSVTKDVYKSEEPFQKDMEFSSDESSGLDEDFDPRDGVGSQSHGRLFQETLSSTDENEMVDPAVEISSPTDGLRRKTAPGQHSGVAPTISPPREPQLPSLSSPTMRGRNGRLWHKDPPANGRRIRDVARERGGPTPESRRDTIMETFSLFLSDTILSVIVRETNRESDRKCTQWNESRPESTRTWKPLDQTELRAYIGLLILSGLYNGRKAPLRDLWSPRTGRSCFLATMSLARFQQITSHMQFDNKATREERRVADKLAAFRDVWTVFVVQLQKWYVPGVHLTVGEQLLASRGRCPFGQPASGQPLKCGIKIWWCCDVATSYPVNGDISLGKQTGELGRKQPGALVVEKLVRPWFHSGRTVVADHSFTSPELAESLLKQGLTYLGAIRRTKGDVPSEMMPSSQRKKFSSIFAFDSLLTMVSYVPRKSKAVILLSTMHHDASVSGDKKEPDVVLDYNKYKGGVKNLNRLIHVATCMHKTNRWLMALFFNLVDVGALSSFIVWTAHFPAWNVKSPQKRMRLFLTELGYQLIDAQIRRQVAEGQYLSKPTRAAISALDYQFPESTSLQAEKKIGRCSLCPRVYDRKSRRKCEDCQRFACTTHLVTMPLCFDCAS